MTGSIELFFSDKLPGTIWKILDDHEQLRLFVEVRDQGARKVSFFALDLNARQWLWKDVTFEESWWTSLAAISGNVLLFTVFSDSLTSDQKSVFAFDTDKQKVLWWRNRFALTGAQDGFAFGVDLKFGTRQIAVRLSDGTEDSQKRFVFSRKQNLNLVLPFQYREGTPGFESVQRFLDRSTQLRAVRNIEYCEYRQWIVTGFVAGEHDLASYLMVFSEKGERLLMEKTDDQLKGIGQDTFFIFAGYLIFVKNRCELVSYKLV